MPGAFITFEGIDGCGKTTQLQMLADRLAIAALPYLATKEPGGTAIGKQIRAILLNSAHQGLAASAELLLFAADRAQHVREELLPALTAGNIVLCDRYTDATLAYQGYGRELSRPLIEQLNSIATEGLRPDITLLFDLDVELAQSRVAAGVAQRGAADRLDNEAIEFHQRVRQGYLEIAKINSDRFIIIPANDAAEIIFTKVCAAIAPRLPAATRAALQ
jgi:dTMP kinase